ncbi:MAG TPA: hypothetical protein PKH65_07320 [Bacteroidia bacterium]|nr:hypothetical protein [Bacteroidia bacterium]HNT80478.1 hypothetical protein [Bacteroidia bacterium]
MIKKLVILIAVLGTHIPILESSPFIKKKLFDIPTSMIQGTSAYTFKVAVNTKEEIAFYSCTKPIVYIFSLEGTLKDSIPLPFSNCIRMMEYDAQDYLLIMDNDEKYIYRYYADSKRLDRIDYKIPDDWFKQLNHYFRHFEIPSIPTYYYNKDYTQDFYSSRFQYHYNLFLNHQNGFIYQCAYNYIKKINNHKTYTGAKKEDLWVSDYISIRSKMLLIDDVRKIAVYYDRFYNIIYEDFKNGIVIPVPGVDANSEPARFDYTVNKNQDQIYGISSFNRNNIEISVWIPEVKFNTSN